MRSALKKPFWIFKHLLSKRVKVISRPQNIFVGTLIALFLFATPVYAESWSAWFQSQFSLKTVMYGAICELVGCGLVEQKPKQNADGSWTGPSIALSNNQELGGVLGFGAHTMIAMYNNPPTSSTYYLVNLGKEFGVVSPAYAQVAGSGANMIRPVEQLWQIMRNVSYMFFIIIFVAIGFMIMLRQKLNPQTVITVQSALPGLVVGLILVTFSYFIAALITDLAFVGVQLVAQIFMSVVEGGKIVNVFDPLQLAKESSIMSMYKSSLWQGVVTLKDSYSGGDTSLNYFSQVGSLAGSSSTGDRFTAIIGIIVGLVVTAITGAWVPVLLGAGAVAVAALAIPLIVVLVLLIALTIQFGKLIFKLLMSYIMILITTALGPLYITFSILPGKGNFMGMWWKTILGNALVFPAVFAVFLFAGMILATDSSRWTSTPPLFGDLSVNLIQPLIAYVILLGTPAVPDMVKKAVGVADLGPIGATGMGGFMAGYGVGGKALNEAYKRSPLSQYVAQRDKYREARRARALGLDRYDEARTIELAREQAAAGSRFQGLMNRYIFGFKQPRGYGTTNAPYEARARAEAEAQRITPQTATEAQGVDVTPEQNN